MWIHIYVCICLYKYISYNVFISKKTNDFPDSSLYIINPICSVMWLFNQVNFIPFVLWFDKLHIILLYSPCYIEQYITWWRNQMGIFSALRALCVGNSPVTSEFPHKASNEELWWFFFWSAPWINGWVNNREAGDLRRHRTHYGVIVMFIIQLVSTSW